MKLNREWINSEFVDLSHISDKEYVDTPDRLRSEGGDLGAYGR